MLATSALGINCPHHDAKIAGPKPILPTSTDALTVMNAVLSVCLLRF